MWETLKIVSLHGQSCFILSFFLIKKTNELNHGAMETALKLIQVQGGRIQL